MVVGTVGRRSPRSLRDLLDPRLQDRIVGLDGDGEPAVRLGVFMAAVDLGLAGKSGELGERAPHHRIGRFEHPAATEREQRIAAEGDLVVLIEMIGDMAERMPGRFDDLRRERPDARGVPLLHLVIEEGNARRVLGRAPHPRVGKLRLELRNALDVIGVMMGDEDIRKVPAALRQSRERRAASGTSTHAVAPVAGSCTSAP